MIRNLIIVITLFSTLFSSLTMNAQENKVYNGGGLFLSFYDGNNTTNIPKGKVETLTYDLFFKKFVILYRDESSKLNSVTFNYVGEERTREGKAVLHYVESVSNDKYLVNNNLDTKSEIIFMRESPIEKKIVSLIVVNCNKIKN